MGGEQYIGVMRMTRFALLVAVLATAAAGADPKPDRPEPKVHRGDGWAIAAPSDWGVLGGARAPVLLYLVGDGRGGVPLLDGKLSPIKAGLVVERFAAGVTVGQFVERDLKTLKGDPRFVLDEEPQVEPVTLADGTGATRLRARFVRKDNGRHSVQRKVYAADAGGRILVATGFVTCSRPGASFVRDVGLGDFVEAHVMSLALDADKLDVAKLKEAYARHAWGAADAVKTTGEANDLLEKHDYAGAERVFREALAVCDAVSAAHNGLAWALLHKPGAADGDVAEALREAGKAVEQTEELDYAALDTLAVGLDRSGKRDRAVETVRKALRLKPNDPELKARLKALGADD